MPSASLPISNSPSARQRDTAFFGHPKGLSTLFFTEMWERFSYYGMRAILMLFMVAPVTRGGLGFNVGKAGAIYGLYTAMVFLGALPGGWLADRITGQRRAVLWGGIVIALGHFCMTVPTLPFFYLGLAIIVVGTGLLKPNCSTLVGHLYREGDSRRDGGFSIYYMGINIGAFVAPLVCGTLGEVYNWHYGFGAAGVGMTLGIIQYVAGTKNFDGIGEQPADPDPTAVAIQKRLAWRYGLITAAVLGIAVILGTTGILPISAEGLSNAGGVLLTVTTVLVFGGLLLAPGWTTVERKRIGAVLVLFIAAVLFWSIYEQAGSTLNLFAEQRTNRSLPASLVSALHLPNPYPASWFQSQNSFFLIGLAPTFAWIWVWLGRRNPSITAKFGIGLFFVALGFLVLVPVSNSYGVSGVFLTLTYFFHTVGELLLSPVGLSAMTKLAPARIAGFTMGIWFLADSIGNYLSGLSASVSESMPLSRLFGFEAAAAIVLGLILLALIRPMRNLTGGVD